MFWEAPFHTEEVMRVIMATFGDLAATATSQQAQTDAQVALLTQLMQQQLTTTAAGGPRRSKFRGGPPRFDRSVEVRGWLRILGLIYGAKGLSLDESFRYTLPLVDGPALKLYEYAHPQSFAALSEQVIARFCDKHDCFHKFQELIALHQRGSDLDGYMDRFMDLFAQVRNMSAQESLAVYLGGVEPSVRVHLLGAAHVDTLVSALE